MQTVNNFLKYDEIEGGNLRQQLRLTLSKMDRAFFEQLIEGIQPTPQTESHKRLRAAREQLHQELIIPIIDDDGLSNAQKIERLLTLRSSLTDDCTVIRIVTDNIREAYRLFSVLNDRGSRLSDGDLLRSSTMEYLDSFAQRQANIEQAWDVILSKKRTQVDGFLRNYYSSLKGVRAPGRDLLDAYDEQILGTPQPPLDDQKASEIERVVLSMRIESEIHAIILEGEWPYQSPEASLWQQSRLGSVIGVLKHTLCIPLLLAAKAKLPESQFAEIVQLVERVAFRYIAMVGAHEGRLGEIYHRAAASIRTVPSEFSVDSLAQEMQSLIDRNAPSDLFRSALAAKLKYTDSSSQKRLVKYFLATIEEHYEWFRNGANGRPNPDTTMIWDINQLTIEHIYPRNSASLDTSLELLKNDLGNLSIWGPNENRGVGNAPFLEKKPRYQQSRMKINQQLALEVDWTTSRVQSRQSALLRNAEKLYKTRF